MGIIDKVHVIVLCIRLDDTKWGKIGFTVVSMRNTDFILIFLFIIFHMNNCKPTLAQPCIKYLSNWGTVEFS